MALFGQIEWSITDRLRLLPGVRFNYDQKDVDFDQRVYGGLQTSDPALIALQRSVSKVDLETIIWTGEERHCSAW